MMVTRIQNKPINQHLIQIKHQKKRKQEVHAAEYQYKINNKNKKDIKLKIYIKNNEIYIYI
jgi:hypothetical protein